MTPAQQKLENDYQQAKRWEKWLDRLEKEMERDPAAWYLTYVGRNVRKLNGSK